MLHNLRQKCFGVFTVRIGEKFLARAILDNFALIHK